MTALDKPIWWTWDHSANWVLNQPGKQTYGASNDYTKRPDALAADYSRAIRWAAGQGIAAIGIAGLLRDSHGGLEAARQIACLGKERGVGIYGIVGLISYGGVYYEGDSPWSLEKFLTENPECLGVDIQGKPLVFNFGVNGPRATRHGCASNPKLQDFVRQSVEWLFRSIPELAGLQFETGDTGVCQCARCRKRRELPAETISFDDMALFYPKVTETVLSLKPSALVICETYHHFLPGQTAAPTGFGDGLPAGAQQMLAAVPKGAYFQWVCDKWLDGAWPEGATMPLNGYRHVMRAHLGTYWMGNSKHRLEIENIRRMCRLSAASGINRVSLFGESSAFHANDEFNYLAQVYFSRYPHATAGEFIRQKMAPCLGDYDKAASYVAANEQAAKGAVTPRVIAGIADLASKSNAGAKQRWLWLGSYLSALHWDKMSSSER